MNSFVTSSVEFSLVWCAAAEWFGSKERETLNWHFIWHCVNVKGFFLLFVHFVFSFFFFLYITHQKKERERARESGEGMLAPIL